MSGDLVLCVYCDGQQ